MNKKFSIDFAKIEPFLIIQTKNSLSTSTFIFSTISQISKTKFYELWAQACRNLNSIKFANFLSITCPIKSFDSKFRCCYDSK